MANPMNDGPYEWRTGIDMLRYFTDDTGLNDVVVHELICSIVRR